MDKKIIARKIEIIPFRTKGGEVYFREHISTDQEIVEWYLKHEPLERFQRRYTFPQNEVHLFLDKWLKEVAAFILMFNEVGKLVGFGDLIRDLEHFTALLASRYIFNEYSGKGYGTALAEMLIKQCRDIFPHIKWCSFEVNEENTYSLRSHTKLIRRHPCTYGYPDEKGIVRFNYYAGNEPVKMLPTAW